MILARVFIPIHYNLFHLTGQISTLRLSYFYCITQFVIFVGAETDLPFLKETFWIGKLS